MIWTTQWTSVERNLIEADGGVTVGWNRFVGTTEIDGATVSGLFLGAVDYVGGSGPWSGFQRFTWPDESTLVLRFDGRATFQAATGDTIFTFTGSVVGGTGKFAGARGSFSGSGSRRSELGGAVELEIRLHLEPMG